MFRVQVILSDLSKDEVEEQVVGEMIEADNASPVVALRAAAGEMLEQMAKLGMLSA